MQVSIFSCGNDCIPKEERHVSVLSEMPFTALRLTFFSSISVTCEVTEKEKIDYAYPRNERNDFLVERNQLYARLCAM
jgi:hypothetical protein